MPDKIIEIPNVGRIAFPESMTPEQINAAAGKLYREKNPDHPKPDPTHSWIDTAVDWLPTVGGGVGGVLGGAGGTAFGLGFGGVPGAVAGAAIGGAAGEAARQHINRLRGATAPGTVGQAATDIGTQAGVQAGSELAGQGLMKGAQMAAHGLMDFAIRPAPTVAEEFGDIAGTAIRERLPVGSVLPGGATGSQIARTARRASAQTTRDLLTTAEKMGAEIDPAAMTRGPVSAMASEIAKKPLPEGELRWLASRFGQFLDAHPNPMKPGAVKDLKQTAQAVAAPIYKALRRGNAPTAGQALTAQFNKAIADGAKAALEAGPMGAQIGVSESKTQALIGATQAIRRAEVRRLPLVAELAAPLAGAVVGGTRGGREGVGEGVGTAVLIRALLSPRTTSRVALGLTTPAIEQILRQMPRAAVVSLMNQIDAGEP